MKNEVMILSKEIALLYLSNEFGNAPLKVTTIFNEDECWTGKVILESNPNFTELKTNDFEYLKNIYDRGEKE